MLLDTGISGIGTIMVNRFPNTGLKSDAEMKRSGRGSIDVSVRSDNKLAIVKWMDNWSVLSASWKYSSEPMGIAKRYSKPDKTYINVNRPDLHKASNFVLILKTKEIKI